MPRWVKPDRQFLFKREGKVGLDKLGFCIVSEIDENQMVSFGVVARSGYPPINHLIMSGVQFVGDTLRLAMQKLVELLVIQQEQIDIRASVTGVRIIAFGKRTESAAHSGVPLMRRHQKCELRMVFHGKDTVQKMLRLSGVNRDRMIDWQRFLRWRWFGGRRGCLLFQNI